MGFTLRVADFWHVVFAIHRLKMLSDDDILQVGAVVAVESVLETLDAFRISTYH